MALDAMATTMRTTEDEFPEFAAVTHARALAETPGPPAWATLKVKTGHAPKPKVDRAYVPPPLPSMAAYRFARHQELWKRSEPERLGYERLRRKRMEADAADRKQTLYWGKVSLGRAQAAPRDFWRKGPYKKGPTRSSSTMDGPADLGGEAVLDWSEMADVCYDIVTGGATGGANKAQVAKRLNDMRVRPAKNIYEYLRMPPSRKTFVPSPRKKAQTEASEVDEWADYEHEQPGAATPYVLEGAFDEKFPDNGRRRHFEALAHLIASRPVKLPEESVTEAAWEYDMDIKSVQSHETQSRPINEYRDESGRLAVTDWQLLAQDGSYVPAGTEPPRKDFGTDLKLPSQVPSRPLKVNYGLTAQQAKRLGTAERHEAVWKAIRKSSQLHAPAVLSKEFHKCVRMRADLDYMIAPHRKRPSRASIGSFEQR